MVASQVPGDMHPVDVVVPVRQDEVGLAAVAATVAREDGFSAELVDDLLVVVQAVGAVLDTLAVSQAAARWQFRPRADGLAISAEVRTECTVAWPVSTWTAWHVLHSLVSEVASQDLNRAQTHRVRITARWQGIDLPNVQDATADQ
ncbi:hypothetical protein SAMN05421805_10659 [Saccharopolyspora antimicrobica]|uniref:Serine/threonine-protein kinase RsbW n=1 Tax=Saccharopolyspora antimicrobica TaxID=455193 RepID=A0A1I5AZE7_9PSEU|nr:hypothetical protein ATL45_4785 [Saccharopolyspora antimicrobica]SFN67827.1 hypothetical protein SAMN05421805_10659 [Saccharopolyspora antimicrobica]